MFDDDLGVFYGDDWTVECTRSRPGEDDVPPFRGILATVDAEQFDGTAQLGMHQLQYPTAAAELLTDDVLRTRKTVDGLPPAEPEVWRVIRSPDRIVDGAESLVYLTPDPEA